jgi:glycosyltransferase involved in cell wall biosynthesis
VGTVHVVVPDGVDDPLRPSGGNTYDRMLCGGLTDLGWAVHEHPVPGRWPDVDAVSLAGLRAALRDLPAGSLVVLDGLVGSAAPEVVAPEGDRLRLVVLVHLPLGHGRATGGHDDRRRRESTSLLSAAAVVATSSWTRSWLLDTYALSPGRVEVVAPGVEAARLVVGSASGGSLLCVGAVTPAKGQDLLVRALGDLDDLPWSLTCVGSLGVDPVFAARLVERTEARLGDRIVFRGPRVGRELDEAYGAADLLVAPSRTETFGMVVTEAHARGIPVVVADVGGLPEALGVTGAGRPGGLLVRPGSQVSLGLALRRWLTEPALRRDLREAARVRRATLPDWSATSEALGRVLCAVSA